MHIRPDEIENRRVAVTLRLSSGPASFRMTWQRALKRLFIKSLFEFNPQAVSQAVDIIEI